MADDPIIDRISDLVDEEHAARAAGADPERLAEIEAPLDQCWDLLRQRRAKREYGGNPDEAQVRPEGTVESYLA